MNRSNLKRFVQMVVVGLTTLLSACATSPSVGEASFEVQLIPGRSLQIVQGSSTDFVVQLNRDRFTDPITVTASELPAGVTAGAVTTTGTTATLRFLAAADALQGETKSISIFATADGKTSETVTTSLAVRGAPGALDTTFSGGRVTMPTSAPNTAAFIGAVLAPDGGIVVVTAGADSTTTLTRLTADGKPDPNFPVRTVNLAPGREIIGGIVVQPDGKLIVAARLESAQLNNDFSLGVVRFTAQGELDPSFSGDGKTTLAVNSPLVNAVTVAPDGNIVVVGSIFDGKSRKALVSRFSSDGQPNLGMGVFITDSFDSPETSEAHANDVVVAPDGSIIVAGETRIVKSRQLVLARYRSSGLLDPSFGASGYVIPKFGGGINTSTAEAVILQPDGKIIAAGSARNINNEPLLNVIRLLPNGSFDSSFSGDGLLFLTDVFPSNLLLEPNGRIVIGGTTSTGENDFALTRLEANGKLDLSFGNGGRQTTDFGGTNDLVRALLRTSDGRFILMGFSNNDLALARYWP